MPRSEAPSTFILWTGLFTLSSALRRRVQVPKTLLGGWAAPPNLYVIFVAPPGKARKSTTAGYADDLLDDVPGITRSSTSTSQAALMKKIADTDDSSISILSSEFATFILKSGLDMFDFLTDIYDGKKSITNETIGRGFEFANKPCINMLAATTPEWIATGMPESVIGGGFASRVIFIYEDKVRRRQLIYKNLDYTGINRLHDDLKSDLIHIATNIAGDFAFDNVLTEQWINNWYVENADKLPPEQYKLHGYYERKPAHILKVAQLLHVAYSDELVLTQKDLENAITILEQVEKNLPKAFNMIGKNRYTVDMRRILEYIQEKKKVGRRELLSNFYQAATPNLLNELVAGLIQMGAVVSEYNREEEEAYYIAV